MTSSDFRPVSRAFFLPLLLIIAAAAFRWAKLKGYVTFEVLENFSPWMALAFTGTLVFPRRVSFLLIPLLLVLIDATATGAAVLHWEALVVYACFASSALLASRWRGHMSLLGTLLGVTGCAIAFYFITNTVSWLSNPVSAYAMNFSGWLQAVTTGEPGHLPTWFFLRNSLVSDLGFSLLLLAAYNTEASIRQQQRIPLRHAQAA
ncbi:DUF6580 family putative transport protein [Prosthecobacter fluviatilis]|uniref:DUF6580 family putative transport protein n=1 Tax=Prosthecobacter fluviatilis TaxID=445931 RepID=A0ABW0KR87_9BACT